MARIGKGGGGRGRGALASAGGAGLGGALSAAFVAFLVTSPGIQAQGTEPEPILHHAHLNSTDPDAAIDWYLRVWPAGRAGTMAGYPAFLAEMPLLFNRVAEPPVGAWDPKLRRTEPQSSFWHIGGFVDTTDRFEALEAEGVQVLRLRVGPEDRVGVVRSGLAPYGGVRTAEALPSPEADAEPARPGGFGYLVGPDGALVELTGSPRTDPEFAHVHLYHEQPRCAANWYVDVLGFRHAPGRAPNTGERVERDRWDPCTAERGERGWPSLEAVGTVRAPSATVVHRGGGISIYPRQCTTGECDTVAPLAPSRGQVLDHVAFAVPDLAPVLERIRSRGVTVIEGPYDFEGRPAVLLEGPDGLALEVVEVGTAPGLTPPGG